MKKRFIALLLCCVMLLTLSPSLISAASATDINGTTVETPTDEPTAEPTVETPTDEPTAEPTVETPTDEPTAEPKTEEPKAEEPKAEEPKAEEPKAEEPKAEDETTIPAAEQSDAPVEGEIITPTVNFTNVAPFLPPVTGVPQRRAMAKTFSATPRANDTATDSGIVLNKTATANDNDTYTITLEAYATGSKVISQVTEDVPTDIVLVLDQSGSMGNCIVCGEEMNGYDYHDTYNYTEATRISNNWNYFIKNGSTYAQVYYCNGWHWRNDCEGGAGWYTSPSLEDHTAAAKITPKTTENPDGVQFYTRQRTGTERCTSRLSALKTAVTNFAKQVETKAKGQDGISGTEDDVDHRIAVVGFSCSNTGNNDNYNDYQNTEVFIGDIQYKYGSAARGQYKNALQSMKTIQGQNNVTASIAALTADGATYVNHGIEMANGILNANPVPEGEKRNRVVIVFTDGVPGYSGFESDVADSAINQANTAKNTYKATVYTVGIFSGADATSAGAENGNGTDKANWFMQNLSSNNGKVQNPSYYLSAADADSLKNIFQQISDQIETGGSSTTLDENAVIKDIISPQFTLPAGAMASDITLETYKCTGKNGDVYTWTKNATAMGAEATIEGSQVSVTGFDFAENWCGTETNAQGNTTAHGNKLVISFTVSPKAGFLGGNNVYTNTSAGVYENANATNPVLEFERPQVNVPIDAVTVTATEKNVYLLGGLTAAQLKEGATVKVGDVSLDLSADNYGLEAWQTAYVDITVEVKGANGNAVTDLTDLMDDTTYTVSIKVEPKSYGTGASGTPAAAKSNTGTGNINVFKPELTFQDSEVYYGDTAPDYTGNLTDTEWKHGDTASTTVTMIGTAPTLSLTYTPEAGKIADGKINTKQDIAVDVAVKIDEADVTTHTTFQHTDCEGRTCTVPAGKEFLLHVKTCQLTITKNGGNANEPYVFTVFKDNEKYSEVTVMGGGSETICELPVGTYTIQEDTGWSWRFTPTIGGGVTLSKDKASNTITCTNTKANDYWLNGFSNVEKNIFGVKH